jgi:hypothetical protein
MTAHDHDDEKKAEIRLLHPVRMQPPLSKSGLISAGSRSAIPRTIGILYALAQVVQLELLLWWWLQLDAVYRWKDWEHFGHVVGLTFGVVGLFWIAVLLVFGLVLLYLVAGVIALFTALVIHLVTSTMKRRLFSAGIACAAFPAGAIVGLYALHALESEAKAVAHSCRSSNEYHDG